MAARKCVGLSLKLPSIELHGLHRSPRIFPVLWEWSTASCLFLPVLVFLGGERQMAHCSPWMAAMSLYF